MLTFSSMWDHKEKEGNKVTRVASIYIKEVDRRKIKNGQEGRKWDQRVNHEENFGLQVLL